MRAEFLSACDGVTPDNAPDRLLVRHVLRVFRDAGLTVAAHAAGNVTEYGTLVQEVVRRASYLHDRMNYPHMAWPAPYGISAP